MSRKKARSVKIGDTFCILTPCGPCRFQYVQKNSTFGELISVLSSQDSDEGVAECKRDFEIFFPVTAASREDDVEYIGNFDVPKSYRTPASLKYPLEDSFGKQVGWMIHENGTNRRVLHLSKKEQSYVYAFAINIKELERLYCMRWNSTMPYPS